MNTMDNHPEPGTEQEKRIAHDHHLRLASRSDVETYEPLDPRLLPTSSISQNLRSSNPEPVIYDDGGSSRTISVAEHPLPHKTDKDLEEGSPDQEPIYVEFEKDDPRDPFNFSIKKKWLILLTGSTYTALVAATASAYAISETSLIRDLHTSKLAGAAGLSTYAAGFAIFPLLLSPLSEEFGRKPMYMATCALYSLMYIPMALSVNIEMVIIFRFVQGAFASTGATMVGGTVADIFRTHERGIPMAVYSAAALFSTGAGAVIGGWIEQNPNLEWRWVQWIYLMVSGVFTVMLYFLMSETRGSIILKKLAQQLRQETGDNRYRARIEDEQPALASLVYVSCTRPIWLLVSEPVVFFFSLWLGFVWGVLYGLVQSISLVFTSLYDFTPGQVGGVFATICIGTLLGFITNFWQEKIYREKVATRGPEARLYSACAGGAIVVVGCFIYAWTSYPFIHWIAPCIGITVLVLGMFHIYLAVFNYLADAYLIYASSALSGQSFFRNMMAAIFPLFTSQMYRGLGYHWASTLFGCIAILLSVVPYVLMFWGPKIRAKSRFAKMLAAKERSE